MGMDLEPVNDLMDGAHFDVWSWRPLWDYVCALVEAPEEFSRSWHYNDGALVDAKVCKRIHEAIEVEIKTGRAQAYIDARQKALAALPDEVCWLCHGTGTRKDMAVKDGCNGCQGKGKVRPNETSYSMKVEWLKDFSVFCRDCGGFQVY
jgi:DnaJ-class molecular chaperone